MEAELEAKASIEALAVDKAEDSLTAKNDGKKKASDEEKKEEKLDEEVSCPVCRYVHWRLEAPNTAILHMAVIAVIV